MDVAERRPNEERRVFQRALRVVPAVEFDQPSDGARNMRWWATSVAAEVAFLFPAELCRERLSSNVDVAALATMLAAVPGAEAGTHKSNRQGMFHSRGGIAEVGVAKFSEFLTRSSVRGFTHTRGTHSLSVPPSTPAISMSLCNQAFRFSLPAISASDETVLQCAL